MARKKSKPFTDRAIDVMTTIVKENENRLRVAMADNPSADQYVRGLVISFTRPFTPDEQMLFIKDMIKSVSDTDNPTLRAMRQANVEEYLTNHAELDMRAYYNFMNI